MPSPVGHALGGIAAGWLLQGAATAGPHRLRWTTLAFALLATAPDFDLLASEHRGPTHSLGAVLVVAMLVWLWSRHRGRPPLRISAACAAAYGSHILLDWLGSDSRAPIGVAALWPWSTEYYESAWHLFPAVSRRFADPAVFIRTNLLALARELLILVPVVLLVARLRRPPAAPGQYR